MRVDPVTTAEPVYDQLYAGLGTFWRSVFRDQDFVRGLMASFGLLSDQLWVEHREARELVNRGSDVIYHLERVLPLTIRSQDLNKVSQHDFIIGTPLDAVLGPQTSVDLTPGVYTYVNQQLPITGRHVYPLPVGVVGVQSLHSTPIYGDDLSRNPGVVLRSGVDYVVHPGSIEFNSDPFASGFTVDTEVTPAGSHEFIRCYGVDVDVSRNLVARFLSYPLGLALADSVANAEIARRLWDIYNLGLTEGGLRAYVDAVLGPGHADIVLNGVIPDGVIRPQALWLKPSYIPGAIGGVGFGFASVDIVYNGSNDKGVSLRFAIGGEPQDIEYFWTNFESNAEAFGGVVTVLEPWLYGIRPERVGAVWGRLSPADLILSVVFSTGVAIVVMDYGMLSDAGRRNLCRLSELKPLMNAGSAVETIACLELPGASYAVVQRPAEPDDPVLTISYWRSPTAGHYAGLRSGTPDLKYRPACMGRMT